MKLSSKNKGKLIEQILLELKIKALSENRHYSEGDIFFALCFMEEESLKGLHKKCSKY